VFRIANIPGEPLDVATIVKHRLAAGIDGVNEQELNDTFSRATPGTDAAKDELVVKVVLQVLLPDADVDTVLRNMIGGMDFPTGFGLTPRMTRHRFCHLLSLHADLEVLNQSIGGINEAAQKLFQFEFACTRSNGNDEMVVKDERDFICWRSVAIKILSTLNVRVKQPQAGPTALLDGGTAQVDRARIAFVSLERLMLCYSLPVAGIQRARLFSIMTDILRVSSSPHSINYVYPFRLTLLIPFLSHLHFLSSLRRKMSM